MSIEPKVKNQSDRPALSVLMPCYNAGPYVEEAIQSVLDQDFRDFEFLIIHDGSTDDSLERIRRFDDPRIRVIDQENRGLIDSLNRGLALCRADRVARMDADDVCLPHRFSVQMDYLDNHPDCILVGSQAQAMDREGRYLMDLIPQGHSHEEIVARAAERCPFIHPCVLFYRQVVLDLGGYPKDALTFEDHLLWMRLIQAGRVHNLPEPLLKVRFNPESVTVDEKWRGQEFLSIRKRSLIRREVSSEDAARIRELIAAQNHDSFKKAAYYAMIAKKYLWDQPNGNLARAHLQESIRHYPARAINYILYLFSFLPASFRRWVYQRFKSS